MIVTVTFNPSLDRTMAFPSLERGEVQRADSTIEDPGGKGVNVTRFLTAHGTESLAVLPVGDHVGDVAGDVVVVVLAGGVQRLGGVV